MIEIPYIGELEKDQFDDWLRSKPTTVKALGEGTFEFFLDGYLEDEAKEEFHLTIGNILSIGQSVLEDAQEPIYRYYKNITDQLAPEDDWFVVIDEPEDVWDHVQFGNALVLTRRAWGDELVHVSLNCSCAWEKEHGLQIVFKQGLYVNKVGPYDGHLTYSDAYADDSMEDVVYPT